MKKVSTLIFSMICAGTSIAQIQHTDVVPTRVIKGSASAPWPVDSVYLHLAHPLGTITAQGKDSALLIWHFDATPPGSNDVGANCRGMNVEVLELASSPYPTQAAAIDSGIMIDASAGTWERPNYIRLVLEKVPGENWDSQTDKYLGVRFKRGSNWHYGWVKMSIDGVPDKVELKGYGYEQTAGKGIPAGAKGKATGIGDSKLANSANIQVKHRVLHVNGLEGKYSLGITDIAGRLVRTAIYNGNSQVDVNDLPAGIYMLKIEQTGSFQTYKISLQ